MHVRLCVLSIVCLNYVLASCPTVISRRQWGAVPASRIPLEIHPPTHVVVHHSATPTCTLPSNCAALVRSIQGFHIVRMSYEDIGYNFLIGEDGNVYEGVGWDKQPHNSEHFNPRSIGICILGDYTSRLPNEKALSALKRLIECGVREGHLNQGYKLLAHRQVESKNCPGQKLYYHIREWTNWSAA